MSDIPLCQKEKLLPALVLQIGHGLLQKRNREVGSVDTSVDPFQDKLVDQLVQGCA